jgi:hypothetical protein
MAGLLEELRDDLTPQLVVAAIVLFILTRLLAPVHQERLRSAGTLFALHLVLVLVAGLLRESGVMLYREARIAALILAILSFSGLIGTFLFGGVLLRLRVAVPRILQDVIVATSAILTIFAVASRLGVNLSGLIATSAVLTACCGLAVVTRRRSEKSPSLVHRSGKSTKLWTVKR